MLNSTDGSRIDVSDLIRQVEIENIGSCRLSLNMLTYVQALTVNSMMFSLLRKSLKKQW